MSNIHIIGKNLRFMVLNRIATVLVSFFLFPFIVRYTGQEIYGIYLIVMTVTGYFGIFDFGVMSALTKYVSEYNGKGDIKRINSIINASFSFYVIVGVIVAIVLFFIAEYFTFFFKINLENVPIAKKLFTVAAISALFVWPSSTFRGTIEGLNLWSIEAIVNMCIQICNLITAFMVFNLGYGIILFFGCSQLFTILGNTAYLIVSKRKCRLSFKFPYYDQNTLRHIFSFSLYMFLSSLLNLFLFQIHNIIIGYFISMSAVTIYAVAYNMQNYFRSINSTLGGPPWTVASEMEGKGDIDGQRKLLFKGTKYMTAIFVPMVLIVFFFAEPFIKYWMGPGFEESVLPTRIIILFWIFNSTLEIAAGMLSAKGVVKKPLYIQVWVAITNIIIGISLIKYIGISAIALGLTISMGCIAFPFLLRLSLNNLNVKIREYFDKAIKENLKLYGLTIILSFLTINIFYPKNMFFTIVEMSAIFTLVMSVLFYFISLDQAAKTEIKQLIGVEINN